MKAKKAALQLGAGKMNAAPISEMKGINALNLEPATAEKVDARQRKQAGIY